MLTQVTIYSQNVERDNVVIEKLSVVEPLQILELDNCPFTTCKGKDYWPANVNGGNLRMIVQLTAPTLDLVHERVNTSPHGGR